MRTKIATKKYDVSKGVATFEFSNGARREIKLDDLSPEMVRQAALHGLIQKGGDSWTNADTVDDAVDCLDEVIQAITAGDWNRKATGDGGILAIALAEVQAMSVEDVRAKLATLDDKEKRKLHKHPKVAAVIARIKHERAERKAAEAQDDNTPLPIEF